MTVALVIYVLMIILGAAFLGWLLRWNAVQKGETVGPRDLARQQAERDAAMGERSA